VLAIVLAIVLPGPGSAVARSEKTLGYRAEKVWPSLVRFLRVDEGLKIVEKDPDAGYVVFEMADEGKTFPGAAELITADDDGGPRVKVVIRIEDRPSYVESAMLERFERKLRDELGSPPPRKTPEKKKKPAPPGDGSGSGAGPGSGSGDTGTPPPKT
jgi:hypothetical protein